MRPLAFFAALLATSWILVACTGGGLRVDDDDEDEGTPDAGTLDTGFPPPRTDVSDALGAPETLEIAAWNVRNFPCGNASFDPTCRPKPEDTPALVADVIASLDLDLVALEEITDVAAFDELVARLPEHEGVLSSDTYGDGTFQKVGFLYRKGVLEAGAPVLLFQEDRNFPRPPLQVSFTWVGPSSRAEPLQFFAVVVHLKAGEDPDDYERRASSIARLESYARTLVDGAGDDDVVLLGDFNEVLDTGIGRDAFAPFLDATRYSVRTEPNADRGEVSFLPSGVILDHVVTTASLAASVGSPSAVIPRLDFDVEGYRNLLSDHLPVVLVVREP